MKILLLFRRLYLAVAFLFLMFTLPCIAQNQPSNLSADPSVKTPVGHNMNHSANVADCKGKMNCYTPEMRRAAAIRTSDRKAQAQIQAQKKAAAEKTQGEVKQ